MSAEQLWLSTGFVYLLAVVTPTLALIGCSKRQKKSMRTKQTDSERMDFGDSGTEKLKKPPADELINTASASTASLGDNEPSVQKTQQSSGVPLANTAAVPAAGEVPAQPMTPGSEATASPHEALALSREASLKTPGSEGVQKTSDVVQMTQASDKSNLVSSQIASQTRSYSSEHSGRSINAPTTTPGAASATVDKKKIPNDGDTISISWRPDQKATAAASTQLPKTSNDATTSQQKSVGVTSTQQAKPVSIGVTSQQKSVGPTSNQQPKTSGDGTKSQQKSVGATSTQLPKTSGVNAKSQQKSIDPTSNQLPKTPGDDAKSQQKGVGVSSTQLPKTSGDGTKSQQKSVGATSTQLPKASNDATKSVQTSVGVTSNKLPQTSSDATKSLQINVGVTSAMPPKTSNIETKSQQKSVNVTSTAPPKTSNEGTKSLQTGVGMTSTQLPKTSNDGMKLQQKSADVTSANPQPTLKIETPSLHKTAITSSVDPKLTPTLKDSVTPSVTSADVTPTSASKRANVVPSTPQTFSGSQHSVMSTTSPSVKKYT